MKAIVMSKTGKNFSTMHCQQMPSPILEHGEVRVRMISSRINPVDLDLMSGMPFLKFKRPQIGGVDGAGQVIEVGAGVTGLQLGDKVCFYRKFNDIGAWAEEITVQAEHCAKIPNNIMPAQIGGVTLPILTAYDALMHLGARSGQSILIHGAGGGVGFQAVVLSKAMGLRVLGTGSKDNEFELVASGIDKFIDYRTTDFARMIDQGSVDFILDTIGGEVLMKSIGLRPKAIISLKLPNTANLDKTGIRIPKLLRWLIDLTTFKYRKAARNHGVKLIGQVTSADGKMLQQSMDWASKHFIERDLQFVPFDELCNRGIARSDVGKTIFF